MPRLLLPTRALSDRPDGSATIARARLAATLSTDRRRTSAPEASLILARLLAENSPEGAQVAPERPAWSRP